MSTELAVKSAPTDTISITTMDELARVADMFAKSGMFADARDAAQAGVRILAGQAWGIDPFTAMTAVQMIQNRPAMSAGVMAAKVKGHPKYDYVVNRLDGEACEIEFFQGDRSLGVSSFTIEDAKQAGYAGKQNYKQTPRNMLFARALSNGVRWFTPDVFSASVYTPEDFMGESEGDLPEVKGPGVREKPLGPPQKPAVASEPAPGASGPPWQQEAPSEPLATPAQVKAIAVAMREYGVKDRDTILTFLSYRFGRGVGSSKELTKREASELLDWQSEDWEEALAAFAARDLPTDATTSVMGDDES